MKISEAPMLKTLVCKHSKADYSELFEITKIALSENSLAVYLRVIHSNSNYPLHYWRELSDLDEKWEIFDTLG